MGAATPQEQSSTILLLPFGTIFIPFIVVTFNTLYHFYKLLFFISNSLETFEECLLNFISDFYGYDHVKKSVCSYIMLIP